MLGSLQIRKHLCFVNWQQHINRLEFNDKFIIDQKIQSALPDKMILVLNRNCNLPYKRDFLQR